MGFEELAASRFSVRKFSDRKVDRETLDKILSIAKLAPTAKNFQPQRIYVLESNEAIARIDEFTPCRYGAPTVLLFAYDSDEEWNNPREEGVHSGVEDVSIVATHVMLYATELGVDNIWVNVFENSKVEEAFGLPKTQRSVLLMPIGYRADDCEPAPRHTETKELDQMVSYL